MEYKFNNKKFIKVRKEKGFTQKALAKILVHKYHIPNIYDNLSLIERNMRPVKEDELKIFIKVLNVNINDICDRIESKKITTITKSPIKEIIKNKTTKVLKDKKRQEYHNKIVYQMTINLTRYLKSDKVSSEMKDICKEILLNTLNNK